MFGDWNWCDDREGGYGDDCDGFHGLGVVGTAWLGLKRHGSSTEVAAALCNLKEARAGCEGEGPRRCGVVWVNWSRGGGLIWVWLCKAIVILPFVGWFGLGGDEGFAVRWW
ncbi:hypothetical protein M0R45_019427 [Rubus argutus]|uniref:Transmembrane protein n=1 Tax=Rubus argutus TaxID=59490 RepID=A0AAW1X6P7_RUBAR